MISRVDQNQRKSHKNTGLLGYGTQRQASEKPI